MSEQDAELLREELDHFRREKEKIRMVVGQIGGAKAARHEKILTTAFVVAIVFLFAGDVLRHLLGVSVPLPPLFSLEVGVLLVSLKIIWMIHKQAKVEHFQFWILNSIEFRLNEISRRIQDIADQGTKPPEK
jgi:hypothetical protein